MIVVVCSCRKCLIMWEVSHFSLKLLWSLFKQTFVSAYIHCWTRCLVPWLVKLLFSGSEKEDFEIAVIMYFTLLFYIHTEKGMVIFLTNLNLLHINMIIIWHVGFIFSGYYACLTPMRVYTIKHYYTFITLANRVCDNR